jgi:hypothetical protein
MPAGKIAIRRVAIFDEQGIIRNLVMSPQATFTSAINWSLVSKSLGLEWILI